MAYELPDWLADEISAENIRSDSRFTQEQVSDAFTDEGDFETAIERFAAEQAPSLLGRARRAGGSLGFPTAAAKLAIAYPADPHGLGDDATDEEIEDAEEANEATALAMREAILAEQKANLAMALRELIIARMYKVQPDEDSERIARVHQDGRGIGSTGGARIGSPEAIMAELETQLVEIRIRYQCNNETAFA